MLSIHKEAFFKTANSLRCWIGLREPNNLSDKYIGKGGHTAKNEHCKAKSADNPAHKFSGLVVNPEVCPESFLPRSLESALKKWKSFMKSNPPNFSTDGNGLVKFQGKAIHADFDLMYVCKADANGRMLPTTTKESEKLVADAGKMINQIIGSRIVMHGAELNWKGDEEAGIVVGAKESEPILSFGPDRQFRVDISSMATEKGRSH